DLCLTRMLHNQPYWEAARSGPSVDASTGALCQLSGTVINPLLPTWQKQIDQFRFLPFLHKRNRATQCRYQEGYMPNVLPKLPPGQSTLQLDELLPRSMAHCLVASAYWDQYASASSAFHCSCCLQV